MDAFTFFVDVETIFSNYQTQGDSIPTNEDSGGSGNNAYCVIA